ncbi:MAG: DUF5305 domain-containing protein, partial [Halovenus sp.]
MDGGKLRVRAVLDEYLVVIAVVLVALVALGGFLTYGAYGQTDERTETTTTTEVTWSSSGQFTHQATVVNDTRVYEVGETLENRSVYFQKITPRLDGSFVYNYTADSGNLTADTSLRLLARSVSEDDQESQQEYWRIEEPLDRTTTRLSPGEHLRVSFSQNVTRLSQEIEQVQTELGSTIGTTETIVVADVQLNGTRNGEPVETNRTYRLPLELEGDRYRVNDSGPEIEQDERTLREQQSVVVPPGPLWRYGGPLALLAGLLGLVGTAYTRYAGHVPLSEREKAFLAYRTDRNEFDEWITEATFPAERVEEADTRIETTSLSGLVDLAIDSDRRVIEVADRDEYLVLDGDVVYSYDAPTLPSPGDPLEPADRATPGSVTADGEHGTSDASTEHGSSDDSNEHTSSDGSAPEDVDTENGDSTSSGSIFERLWRG